MVVGDNQWNKLAGVARFGELGRTSLDYQQEEPVIESGDQEGVYWSAHDG